MKKGKHVKIIILLALVALLVFGLNTIYDNYIKDYYLQIEYSNFIDDVDVLRIDSLYGREIISEKEQIKQIIDKFNDIKLRKTYHIEPNISADFYFYFKDINGETIYEINMHGPIIHDIQTGKWYYMKDGIFDETTFYNFIGEN